MQDRFKVGDYAIFRRGMHKVADMLNTSFYDVLTCVYEIVGTEGRCYLMKSGKACGRAWKIRKSRIDKLGTKVTITNDVAVVMDDECERKHDAFEWQGFRLVPKSAIKREQQHSHDLLDAAVEPWMIKHIEEFERLQNKRKKEVLEELAKAKGKAETAKIKELSDALVKDVEKMIKDAEAMTEAMCRVFDRCRVREKLDAYDIDITKLKGGKR